MKPAMLASLVFLFAVTPSAVAQNTTITIDPSQVTLQVGQACTLEVCINNVSGLGSFEFKLCFNSSIVHVEAALLGNFIGSTGRTVIPVTAIIDNGSVEGSVRYGAATLGSSQAGASGSGVLALVVITARGNGTTDLALTNTLVTDIAGTVITIQQAGKGSVVVNSGSGHGAYQWVTLPTATNRRLNRIQALNENDIWAVGNFTIVKSADGGNLWMPVENGNDSLVFYSLWAVDKNSAFAGGYAPGAGRPKLYKTTDGGNVWTLVHQSANQYVNYIFMTDQIHGFFFGDAMEQKWVIMQTDNGGLTWTALSTAPTAQTGEVCLGGSAYWWDGQNRICFVSNQGRLLSSDNLGASWTSSSLPGTPTLGSLAFESSGTIGLTGAGDASGRIFRTINAGLSWAEILAPVEGTIYGIHYHDAQFWLLINNQMYSSADVGAQWRLEATASAQLKHINFIADTNQIWGWAVGNLGQILKYTPADNCATLIVETPSSTPEADKIYLAGSFNFWDPGPAANGTDGRNHDLLLQKASANTWQITLALTAGMQIKYKYTRGAWEQVEKGAMGEEIPDRIWTVPGLPSQQNDLVANWADITMVQSVADRNTQDFRILGNYPNPFNSRTALRFIVAQAMHVSISVYNMNGQKIATIMDQTVPPGSQVAHWDGKNKNGSQVAAGVYWAVLQAGDKVHQQKMAYIK